MACHELNNALTQDPCQMDKNQLYMEDNNTDIATCVDKVDEEIESKSCYCDTDEIPKCDDEPSTPTDKPKVKPKTPCLTPSCLNNEPEQCKDHNNLPNAAETDSCDVDEQILACIDHLPSIAYIKSHAEEFAKMQADKENEYVSRQNDVENEDYDDNLVSESDTMVVKELASYKNMLQKDDHDMDGTEEQLKTVSEKCKVLSRDDSLFEATPHETGYFEATPNDKSKFEATLNEESLFKATPNEEHLFKATPNEESLFKATPNEESLFKATPNEESLFEATPNEESLFEATPNEESLFKATPNEENLFKATPNEESLFKATPNEESLFKATPNEESLFEATPNEESLFEATPNDKSKFEATLNEESLFKATPNEENLFKATPNEESLFKATPNEESLFKATPNEESLFEATPNEESLFEATPNEESLFKATPNEESLFEATPNEESLFEATLNEESLFKATPNEKSLFESTPNEEVLFEATPNEEEMATGRIKEDYSFPKPVHSSQAVKIEKKRLPIDDFRERILQSIEKHRVICVQGETGSGKSTRVPQYIVEDYRQKRLSGEEPSVPKMIITQPRRIAAKSLAKRVAEELGEADVGGIVGYKMGREQKVTQSTQICFVTSGHLIEMLIHRPGEFDGYSHVIMDEIHERELDADLLSLMVRILMTQQLHPKLIIMSATLDAQLFLEYFGGLCEGDPKADRLLYVGVKAPYKVDTAYIEDMDGLFRGSQMRAPKAFETLSTYREKFENEIMMQGKKLNAWPLDKYLNLGLYLVQATAKAGSSVLVFLPGVREIEDMYDRLFPYEKVEDRFWPCKLLIFPFHSKIPFEDQQECFRPPEQDTCHVILATNIAESSVTLPDISIIIDFGQRRHVTFDTKKRLSVLQLDWCSQASMNQRKGRTGRVCDGLCIRVMTRTFFDNTRKFDEAQMKKAPLDKLFLRVKQVARSIAPDMAPTEVLNCAVEPPDTENVNSAIKSLAEIGALSAEDEHSDMTLLGRVCLNLPVDLHLCRMVMFGVLLNKPCDAILMAASLQSQDPFSKPSIKILKNQDKFIQSQRRSYDARCRFDRGTYSEPIMLRNMLIDWIQLVHSENKERRREKNKNMKQTKKQRKSLKDFRKDFARKNSLDPKRLSQLEGVVLDLAEKILKWIPKEDEAGFDVEALIDKIPRKMKQFADEDPQGVTAMKAEHFDSVGDLFAEDILLLHLILTASLVPKFVYGEIKEIPLVSPNYKGNPNKARRQNTDTDLMNRLGMDPAHSVCISTGPKSPKINDDDDDIEDMIQCVSLEKDDYNHDHDLFRMNWEAYEVRNGKLFIEFSQKYYKQDIGCGISVTQDVNKGIRYVFQFVKEGTYHVSETKEGAEKRAVMSEWKLHTFMVPQHPYRIQWQLMSSEESLPQAGRKICVAYPEWRNPAGFMFDVNEGLHLGLAAGITAHPSGEKCWLESFSALPTHHHNLYSVLLLLTFLPHKHPVYFHIDKQHMAIHKVTIFGYEIPINRCYPLTKNMMKIVNKIREITSLAFRGVDSKSFRKAIYKTDLPRLYDLLAQEMDAYDTHVSDDSEDEDCEVRHRYTDLVCVNGFTEDPNREAVADVYLKPYNVELLFTNFILQKHCRNVFY